MNNGQITIYITDCIVMILRSTPADLTALLVLRANSVDITWMYIVS